MSREGRACTPLQGRRDIFPLRSPKRVGSPQTSQLFTWYPSELRRSRLHLRLSFAWNHASWRTLSADRPQAARMTPRFLRDMPFQFFSELSLSN